MSQGRNLWIDGWLMRLFRLENVKCFNHLDSMITNYARYTREIKSRTAMAKAAFNRTKILFNQQIGLKFKELLKCFIWYTAWCGADTWDTSETRSEIPADVLKCDAAEDWRRSIGPIVWKIRKCVPHTIKRRKANWMVTSCVGKRL
jgi:hypothetical protein